MNKRSTINISYLEKPLCNLELASTTTFNDLRNEISTKYSLHPQLITFSNKNIVLNDYQKLVNSTFNDSTNIDLALGPCDAKFSFCQMDNEENCFVFNHDLINTTIASFKEATFNFFKNKMNEFNYIISNYEFYLNNNEDHAFFQKNKPFSFHFASNNQETGKFYFLIKNESVVFYKTINSNQIDEIQNKVDKIMLRQDVSNGQSFKIVIQTYNHLIKELNVYPEMTIGKLKEMIEEEFLVRKEYQELLYLVYKLNDDTKTLKDFYIRPQGTIFLRGFFFPIIFVDFYQKSNKNVISINIAERISFVKGEIISKFALDNNYSYKLIFNGKELNDDNFLIDYNVQRMQMIYFK